MCSTISNSVYLQTAHNIYIIVATDCMHDYSYKIHFVERCIFIDIQLHVLVSKTCIVGKRKGLNYYLSRLAGDLVHGSVSCLSFGDKPFM